MRPLRLRYRLSLLAVVPAALAGALYGAWWLFTARPPGAGPAIVAVAAAIGVGAILARRLEKQLVRECEWLVGSVRRIRDGEFGRVSGHWTEPVVERLATEIDALADEIDRTQRGLQDRIGEATRELQDALAELESRNAELDTARNEAEAASEFKSRFLANISHEIRTPMNSILGFTELLDQGALDPVQLDYLTTIRSSAQGLLSLLNGILDLSKIESGRMELEHSDTDVNDLLFETYHLFAPQAFAKGVELYVTPAAAAGARVRVDPTRLKQVLVNLASNAVKFTDAGHVRLEATATARSGGGISLTFSFTDTGRGIPADAQWRLFQAFAQGDQSGVDLRAQPTGTGLGLHIASEIVFLMDGLIEFRSEPGAGSEFWFHLEVPRARDAAATCRSPTPVYHALLVAGAEAAAAESRLLAAAGIDVEVCDGPDAALARLGAAGGAAIDAVLVHVPAATLTASERPALAPRLAAVGVPVLAHAYAQGADRRRVLIEAGYDDVVDRIPEPGGLRCAFERAIGSAPDPAAGTPAPAAPVSPPATGQPLDVLVVDDQPANLKLLESYLEGTRYRAVPAQGSDEALYRARMERFDAILLDLHLPERDGNDTARLLREPGTVNAATPIIAVTADAFAERARAALGAGMNDVLIKPVGRGELLERLAAWCGEPTDRDAGATPHAVAEPAPGEPWLYDPDDGLRRAGGRPEVAAELFDMLLRHLPSSRAELQDAHADGDGQRLRAAAHRLKGAAAYCGVPRLRRDLERVEQAIDESDDPAAAVTRALAAIRALEALERSPDRAISLAEPAG